MPCLRGCMTTERSWRGRSLVEHSLGPLSRHVPPGPPWVRAPSWKRPGQSPYGRRDEGQPDSRGRPSSRPPRGRRCGSGASRVVSGALLLGGRYRRAGGADQGGCAAGAAGAGGECARSRGADGGRQEGAAADVVHGVTLFSTCLTGSRAGRAVARGSAAAPGATYSRNRERAGRSGGARLGVPGAVRPVGEPSAQSSARWRPAAVGGGGVTVSTPAAEQCWEAMAEQGSSPLPGAREQRPAWPTYDPGGVGRSCSRRQTRRYRRLVSGWRSRPSSRGGRAPREPRTA